MRINKRKNILDHILYQLELYLTSSDDFILVSSDYPAYTLF